MFYYNTENHQYTNKVYNLENQDIYIPLEIDTEYQEWKFPEYKKAQILTIQVSHCLKEHPGLILTHPDSANIAKHPLFETSFVGLDYLKHNGYKITEVNLMKPRKEIPVCYFDVYGFFLQADLYRMFHPKSKPTLDKFVLSEKKCYGMIQHDRRLQQINEKKDHMCIYQYI